MSLRISSLDPTLPKSGKDCRVCNRRRIKCDQTLPTCKKCGIRNLECPGYGVRVQWDQGIASRAKSTGNPSQFFRPHYFNLPSGQSIPCPASDTVKPPAEEANLGLPGSSDFDPSLWLNQSPNKSTVSQYPEHHAALESGFSSKLLLTAETLPAFLQDSSTQSLIDYYCANVASSMVWVDTPDNPWRTLYLQLATKSPPLLLAILALAAEHSAARFGPSWRAENGMVSSDYRDRSLELLAGELRVEAGADIDDSISDPARQEPANAILATILVLCNLEMVQSDSVLWRIHWQAARTIIRRWASAKHSHAIKDKTRSVLIEDAFGIDVLVASTTFDDDFDWMSPSVIAEDDCSVFTKWLQLLQEITTTERLLSSTSPQIKTGLTGIGPETLRKKFDHTRDQALHFAGELDYASEQLRHDFLLVVEILHHAGLIYGYQCLIDHLLSSEARLQCVQRIFESFSRIINIHDFSQDLVWPLFIAGTEIKGQNESQLFVDGKLVEVMRVTGFSNCYSALEFLRRFWNIDAGITENWMQFARQEAKHGRDFHVY